MNKINIVDDKFIKKLDKPLVVLDLAYTSMYSLNKLREALPYENIVYINDLEKDTYEVTDPDMVQDLQGITEEIKRLVDMALAYDPKLLIVASDSIIEYGKEVIDNINIPKIYITDIICEEVNKNFEFKNMAFFATQGIIEANLYQKNFHYSRLYNLNADNMMDAIKNFKMKTSDSFNQVKGALMPLYKKDIDVIIPSLSNILLFQTEIFEYVKDQNKDLNILKIDEILASSCKDLIKYPANSKLKAKKDIYILLKRIENKENLKALKMNEIELRKSYNKVLNINYKFIYERKIENH